MELSEDDELKRSVMMSHLSKVKIERNIIMDAEAKLMARLVEFIGRDGKKEIIKRSVRSGLEEIGWNEVDMNIAVDLMMQNFFKMVAVKSGV